MESKVVRKPYPARVSAFRSALLTGFVLLICMAADNRSAAVAQATDGTRDTGKIATEAVSMPKAKRRPALLYPPAEVEQFGEGWVNLDFMIDTSGKAFEITVAGSSGDQVFEKAAVEALKQSTFEPGKVNGQPVESSASMPFIFTLDVQEGARAAFTSAYKALQEAVAAKDKQAADDALKAMKVRNLYENACYGLAAYIYALTWGDTAEQLAGLNRAIQVNRQKSQLPAAQFNSALVQTLLLEIKLRRYGEAMEIWDEVQKTPAMSTAILTQLKPVIHDISLIQEKDAPYDVSGDLKDGTWKIVLFKKNFRINVHEGHVSAIKLHCSKGYVRFAFDPDLEYKIGSKYGSCTMYVEGLLDSKFSVTQF